MKRTKSKRTRTIKTGSAATLAGFVVTHCFLGGISVHNRDMLDSDPELDLNLTLARNLSLSLNPNLNRAPLLLLYIERPESIRPPGGSRVQDFGVLAPAAEGLVSELVSAGLSKMMTCCQGRNSSESLKMKPSGLDFAANLFESHLVFGLDGHLGVFATKFDQYQPAAGFKGLQQPFECRLGIGAFVIDIDHQDQVDLAVGKLGVGLGREDAFDIGNARLAGVVSSISSIWGWTSVARTVPLGPTRRARRML